MTLIERLYGLEIKPEEEEDTDLVDVLERVRSSLEVERMTKRFYDQFKTEQKAFQNFIAGIADEENRRWYSSVMLNRLMFVCFWTGMWITCATAWTWCARRKARASSRRSTAISS